MAGRLIIFRLGMSNLGDFAMDEIILITVTNDTSYEACVKGPVAIVNSRKLHFKTRVTAIPD